MNMLQATTQMNHIMLNESKHKEYIKWNSISICSTVGICLMYYSIFILYFTVKKKKQSFSLKTLVSTHKILTFISVTAFISLPFHQTINCLRVETDFIHFGAPTTSWYTADAQQTLEGYMYE